MADVAITIVSHNSAETLPGTLASLGALDPPPREVVAVDNASSDGSAAVLRQSSFVTRVIEHGANPGFTGGQNAAIAATTADIVLCLNPDALVTPGFLAAGCRPFDEPAIGMVSGKLVRTTPDFRVPEGQRVIDSTGIVWTRSCRHLDRGAGEIDRGQYERPEEIFGPSGAAAFYRRAMLEDVAIDGEIFDTDFGSYREDADLAWRARLLGHEGFYEPTALAYHRRVVTPERRAELSSYVNAHSVKNRFLMRIKNEGMGHFLRFAPWILWRDAMVVGYVLVAEHGSLPALFSVGRLLPKTLGKRRQIQSRRRVGDALLARWFRA